MKEFLVSPSKWSLDAFSRAGKENITEGRRKILTADEGIAPGMIQLLAGVAMCTPEIFLMFLDYSANKLEDVGPMP